MDVMLALDQGATEVHAAEVIGHINKMMIEGDPSGYVSGDSTVLDSTGRLVTLPEYSGHVYHDPRVTVVTEDARTYVKRHKNKFDVIYSLSSNTWAALGSGAFALTENYLFTTEAFKDYWNALTDGGFLSMEHQVYMPRLVSEVIDALKDLGVENPSDHFAVYNLPRLRRNVLLLSKRPLTDELRYCHGAVDRAAGFLHGDAVSQGSAKGRRIGRLGIRRQRRGIRPGRDADRFRCFYVRVHRGAAGWSSTLPSRVRAHLFA
jgi:hypothetical protein